MTPLNQILLYSLTNALRTQPSKSPPPPEADTEAAHSGPQAKGGTD